MARFVHFSGTDLNGTLIALAAYMTGNDHPNQVGLLHRWGGLMVVAGAVVIAFLLGFTPEYLRANQLEKELAAIRQQKKGLIDLQQMEQLRGEIDQVFIQAARKNYGLASSQASSFFDHLRVALNDSSDSNKKQKLQYIANRRDVVISGLAKADPAVINPIGMIADEMSQGLPATSLTP